MQFSMGCKFMLWHSADMTKKFHKRNLTFDVPCLQKNEHYVGIDPAIFGIPKWYFAIAP